MASITIKPVTRQAVVGQSRSAAVLVLVALNLAACASTPRPSPQTASAGAGGYKVGKPYQVRGKWYTPAEQPNYNEVGIGSWYGEQFHNHFTANGEVFDMNMVSAAHKTLPLPSLVEVTNLENGRKAVVRVNDRGPFIDGRIIDLSKAAAEQLGYQRQGVAKVRVRYIGRAPSNGANARTYQASRQPKAAPPVAAAPVTVAANQPRLLPSGWLSTPQYLPNQLPPNLAPPSAAAPPPAWSEQAPITAAAAAPGQGFQVQAGAYANRANAERAMAQLSSAGQAQIIESPREGGTLYKVVVNGGDPGQAWAVRDQVAGLGYPDARVIAAQ